MPQQGPRDQCLLKCILREPFSDKIMERGRPHRSASAALASSQRKDDGRTGVRGSQVNGGNGVVLREKGNHGCPAVSW